MDDKSPNRPPMFQGMLDKKKNRGTTPWHYVIPVMLLVAGWIAFRMYSRTTGS